MELGFPHAESMIQNFAEPRILCRVAVDQEGWLVSKGGWDYLRMGCAAGGKWRR